ncbi:response regulator [Azospirillum picis]|uniref:CheY-like chemotaxis protein n=1 Tax=Azospirillum picis TaxID=488438 RepID=A0ABU0MR71_9PROT|nr:response regulator [Azospirillum picis]MBP2302240.1 CheY-like chemotaxis protein [Azospirillum picis]MDQ0535819.1 CheY-like chemotaxis protein [Azospirillum picis]
MGQAFPERRVPVLIVEDEPILRIDAVDMVEQAGFDAVEATNVEHAIRILEERKDIRVVYMDLDMPRGVKGIEIAAAIRNRWPPIEIILTAAFFTAADLDLPVRAEFFPKPIRKPDMIAAMRRMAMRH